MPTAFVIVLFVVAAGLFGWIIYRLRRNKSFATSDAIALLGLVVTLLVAVLPFALKAQEAPPPPAKPAVTIEGPDSAHLGQRTYFTIVSSGAITGEWSVGGFAGDQVFTVDPLPPSHSIYIEPTDASRAGDSFTLAVTVHAKDGEAATATKKFVVVGP
jgi:hypothetical protein